jgi:hypothetical protein
MASKKLVHDLPSAIYICRDSDDPTFLMASEDLDELDASPSQVIGLYRLESVGRITRTTKFELLKK